MAENIFIELIKTLEAAESREEKTLLLETVFKQSRMQVLQDLLSEIQKDAYAPTSPNGKQAIDVLKTIISLSHKGWDPAEKMGGENIPTATNRLVRLIIEMSTTMILVEDMAGFQKKIEIACAEALIDDVEGLIKDDDRGHPIEKGNGKGKGKETIRAKTTSRNGRKFNA